MFSKRITESDKFLELSKTAQCLYLHLCMYADDDGFMNNAKTIVRAIGASQSDFDELKLNGYIMEFQSHVILITHWKIHNYIQKDRYKPTTFINEREQVELIHNSTYVLK